MASKFLMQHNKLPVGRPTRVSLLALVEEAVGELHNRFGGLPTPQATEDIWGEIWLHEAHHSTAIERNTLVLD